MKFPIGFLGVGLPATVAYGDSAGSSSNPTNSYDFGTQDLGTDADGRTMILMIRANNANIVADTSGVTSISVGGVAGTKIGQLPSGNQSAHWSTWILPRSDNGGPTGTTGNVTINRNIGNGFDRAQWVMFAAYDLKSLTPSDIELSTAADPATATIDVLGGGIVTAIAYYVNTTAFTWTGPTEVTDIIVDVSGVGRLSGALASNQPATTGYTATADGAANCNVLAAAWR
jgi:hypothetical protein